MIGIFEKTGVTPLAWEHINFLGDYNFEMTENLETDELRPLNI